MDTYELKELVFEDTPDFVYEYPDSFSVKEVLFQHIGYGLYMVVSEAEKKLYRCDIKPYKKMSFVYLRESEEVLFAYSNKYSTWNLSTIEIYLQEHPEELTLSKEAWEKISALDITVKNSRVLEEWCNQHGWIYEDEECKDLDTPYIRYENKMYVYLNGKVGTRIAEGIYQFKDPLKYRVNFGGYYTETCYLPEIGGSTEEDTNLDGTELTVLYKENWSGGSISTLMSYTVFYSMLGELTKLQRNFIDLVGLPFMKIRRQKEKNKASFMTDYLELDSIIKEVLSEADEKQKRAEEEFFTYHCQEIFQGKGFFRNWKVDYNILFEFNRLPESYRCSMCGFTKDSLCMTTSDGVVLLPYRILRYLRISYKKEDGKEVYQESENKYIGHTFIENSDALELEMAGEKTIAFLKTR